MVQSFGNTTIRNCIEIVCILLLRVFSRRHRFFLFFDFKGTDDALLLLNVYKMYIYKSTLNINIYMCFLNYIKMFIGIFFFSERYFINVSNDII